MKYSSIELDEQWRAKKCPRCGNEDMAPKGEYCPVCAERIVNYCGDELIGDPSEEHPTVYPSCDSGTINSLPGNARHCPYCGNMTTFFQNGYLKAWKDENRAQAWAASLQELDEDLSV